MYHCNRFELAIACRRELSVIGRNEGKLCADRISNDDRRGKMNGIKRSDVVVFDYLFCLGQDLRHRLITGYVVPGTGRKRPKQAANRILPTRF